MSEQITIAVSLEQAEAVVDAVNCMSLLAEGKLYDLMSAYAPNCTPESGFTDQYLRKLAERAQEVADALRPEVDAALKRDPETQEAIHAIKMFRKHLRPED